MTDHWLSPSQINTFLECQRKWGWRYLDGIRPPPNPAAQEGIAGHAIIERYLTTAAIDMTEPLAERAAGGLHHYPPPCTPGMQVEEHFGLRIGSYNFHGYKDVQLLRSACFSCGGTGTIGGNWVRDMSDCRDCNGTGSIPQIWDHKFTANLRWAKSLETLQTDTQVVIYALDAMLRSGIPKCRCNWIYYQRRGAKKVESRQLVVNGLGLIDPLKGIVKTAGDITTARVHYTTATQLPPSVDSCSDYGGCVFQDRCGLTTQEIWQATLRSNAAKEAFA